MDKSSDKGFHAVSKIILCLSIILFAALYSVSFYFKPLGSDGGWYSYPALSISRGGDPAENMMSIGEIKNQQNAKGLTAVFPFPTYRSLRISYASLWIKLFSPTILALKFLSFVEIAILMFLVYYLMNLYLEDKSTVYLLFSFFLVDKSIVLISSADFRPDILIGIISIVIFQFINKTQKLANTMIVMILIVIAVLIQVTSIVPLIFLLSFYVIKNIVGKNVHWRFVGNTICYLGVLVLAFVGRDFIFEILYPTDVRSVSNLSFISSRVISRIGQGTSMLFYKEYLRWKDYFWVSNIAMLFLFLIVFSEYIGRVLREGFLKAEIDVLCVSLFLTVISLIIVDPHLTSAHIIPLIPFFMLFLARELEAKALKTAKFKYVIVFLAISNLMITTLLCHKIYKEGQDRGLGIHSISSGLDSFLDGKYDRFMVLGPTELWPYIPASRNLILIDNTRNGKEMKLISEYLHEIDYIILNGEYRRYRWLENFKKEYPDKEIIIAGIIGKGPERIEICQFSDIVRASAR